MNDHWEAPHDQSATEVKSTSSLSKLIIIFSFFVIAILSGFLGFSLGKASDIVNPGAYEGEFVASPAASCQPTSDKNTETPLQADEKYLEIRTLAQTSSENAKKIIVTSTGLQGGVKVFLTKDVYDLQDREEVPLDIGFGEHELLEVSKDSVPRIFLVQTRAGDNTKLAIADETGRVISKNALSENSSAIGLGTIIEGMFGVKSGSAKFVDESGIIQIEILSGNGKTYRILIDGKTGRYVEGSRQEVL